MCVHLDLANLSSVKVFHFGDASKRSKDVFFAILYPLQPPSISEDNKDIYLGRLQSGTTYNDHINSKAMYDGLRRSSRQRFYKEIS